MVSRAVRILSGLVLVLSLFMVTTGALADPINHPFKNDEIIIKFKPTASQAQKDAILADLGAVQMKHFKRIKSDQKKLSRASVPDAIARYKDNPAIEYIEPNYEITINAIPNDLRFPELWGMYNEGQTGGTPGADISATNAWDVFTGSSDVVIGVIDTGVDYNHPDLAPNIWTNPGEIPDNGIDDDGNGYVDDVHGWDFINGDNDPMDDHGHGTHCSGTIGAVGDNGFGVAGVNWNVKIMGLKFLSSSGSGSVADAVSCLEYATMMGVKLTSNSWGGGGYSDAMVDAIADAGANGALFVAAAGNSGTDNDSSPHYPSSYDLDNVVAVASTDHNDNLSSFSCYGATSVDLAAPGSDIMSTLPGNSYGFLSGTSMATPHVSGALGLVFGRFPAIDGLDAKNLIMNFVDPIEELDGLMVSGGRLNAFFPIADPDSIAPGRISDLMVVQAGSNWLEIAWTAPGDDEYEGKPSRYDVRWSTAPITEANWADATLVAGEPSPGFVGTAEQMRFDGLDFETTYYVGIKALDEFGNAGELSNVPAGTTLGIPDIAASPESLSDALLTGGVSYQTVTISNVGFGTLDYTIPTPTLLGGPVTVNEYVPLAKGELDTRTGGPVLDASGGPDSFGYRWVDSNDPFGPTYAWTDISGTGAVALSSGDDSAEGPFALGFEFPFYDAVFTEFYICSNGFISLSEAATDYGNQPLPSTGAPAHMIAPFWDDLVVDAGTVYYENLGGRMVVQWDGVSHYGDGGPYTFQAVLYADGTIEYLYESMSDPTNSATVGLQNGTGTDGLHAVYNAPYVTDGLAVQFRAIPQWVTVAPTSGTIWAPGSETLDVTFDATGLMGGDYDGIIRVVSNDPDEPDFEIPVQLNVTGAPDISVEPLSVDFGDLFLGATATAEVVIRNIGTDDLTIAGIAIDEGVFTADADAFVLTAGSARVVTVTFDPAMATSYAGTMTVTSDDADEPSIAVSLSGAGLEPPQFAVDPTSMTSALYTGESEQQTFTLSNSGGADFEFDLHVEFEAQVTVHEYEEVAKDGVDTRAGVLGNGGPDLYGYRWVDSDDPGGPIYDWTDISATGTPVFDAYDDDGNSGPLPIGFDFSFYGETFGTFNVCSNGWLSFTSTSTAYSNQLLPNTGAPENLLAPFWDDLKVDPANGANVFYLYDGAKLIVQYDNVPRLGTGGGPYTFQTQLYPDGTIMYLYSDMQGDRLDEATIGIQNAARDDGLTVAFNAAYVHDGLAVRLQAFPEWLSVAPASGVVPPGGSLDVTAAFNASGMFGGVYDADVMILSNDPSAPEFALPAQLTVTGAPDLAVNNTAFDFGERYLGQPTLQNLIVSNIGTDDLTISGVSIDNPMFTTSLTAPVVLGPTQGLVETVGFNPTATGEITGTLTLTTDDPDTPSFEIPLTGVGVSPPIAGVDPTYLYADLYTGESESQTVTLSNTGESDLVFDVSTLLVAAESVVHAYQEIGKDEIDTRPGVLGSGGPDMFGYNWIDSDEAGGPVFDWVDISATGTPAFTSYSDDRNSGELPLGFTFPFYGEVFDSFRVCSNGWISFTSTSTSLSNQELPNDGAPENLLAVFWDDLKVDPANGSNVYYEYDGTKLVVQYDNVPRYGSGGPYTFQVLLYPSGTIMYQYLDMQGERLDEATVGIQNGARDDGLTVAFNTDYIHDNLAIRIASIGEWLSATPASGTLPAGASIPLNVVFNAEGMFGGSYDGALLINSNDPVHGQLRVDATLDVTGVPVLAVDPASLAFGDVFIGYDSSLELMVTNAGTDLLTVTDILSSSAEYTVVPTAFELDPLAGTTVTVTFAPTAEGPRPAELSLVSNDAASPMTVALTGTGLYPPIMTYSPDTMFEVGMPGMVKTTTMTICNDGGSDLVWSMSSLQHAVAGQVQYDSIELGKDEVDTRPGILGSGGPDAFGYTWIDSDDPGGPAYEWTDISGTGTPLFSGTADDVNTTIPVGFTFPFYGNEFTDVNICSNGWLSFTSTSTDYSNDPLPNTGAPENLIAPFWDDLRVNPTNGNNVYYQYDGTKLVVQWDDVPHYYATGSLTFQVHLYPDGSIYYYYETMDYGSLDSATVGIQNAAKDDGLLIVYNDVYVHDNMAVRIASAPDWLSAYPESGVVPAGECTEITVVMDATSLEEGDHTGALNFTTNDPALEAMAMDVMFHIETFPAAYTSVEPETLNLDSVGKWITAYVTLPEGYDPMDVMLETVMFNGVVPADPNVTEIDGMTVMFKFDRSLVEAALSEGEEVPVTVTGEVDGIAYFVGTDTIRVIRPRVVFPNGGEALPLGRSIDVVWELPDNWNVDHSDLWYSADAGETWTRFASDIEGSSYTWLTPNEPSETVRIRVIAYDNQGEIGFDTSDEPFALSTSATGVNDGLPKVYALAQNHPNPFNPMTTIRFDLPKAGRTKLAIYDLRGRMVAELLSRELTAGSHDVVWRGQDRFGQQVASGVYYYRIESGEFTQTKSMVLLK